MKIVLLQLKRIGDLILTTPVIRSLREAYPKAHLTLVADASCRTLLECLPVDEWLVYERGREIFGFVPQLVDQEKKERSLSALRPDWCLDFTGTDRSGWFTFASNAPHRATFARFRKSFVKKFVYSHYIESSVRNRHTADHYTDLLEVLDIKTEGVPLELRIPDAARDAVERFLEEERVPRPFAVIHAGTARPEKYWLPERWAAVAEELHSKYGLGLVLSGSKAPEEQEHLAKIRGALTVPVHDFSGRTNLTALAALIEKAEIFCGVDTAAMHLADAVETPTLPLYGPTNLFHWRPRFAHAKVIRAGVPEPFAPGQKGAPMSAIEVPEVLEALKALIDRP